MEATRDNYIGTLTAGLATESGNNSRAIAGSVSLDFFYGDTEAYLDGVSGSVDGELRVTATDNSIIVAITAAASKATTSAVGVAVSYIQFTHTVEAYAADTDLTVNGEVDIEATTLTAIGSLGVAGRRPRQPAKPPGRATRPSTSSR